MNESQTNLGKVALVDDSATSRMLLSVILKAIGLEVITYEDPVIALDQIPKNIPEFILVDFEMPTMNGAEFCQKAKALSALANTPIIILSAHETDDKILQCIRAGATDYLPKKLNPEIMAARIQLILEAIHFKSVLLKEERLRTYNATVVSLNHEFNNINSIVIGLIDKLVKNPGQLDQSLRENLVLLEKNLLRLSDAISSLESLSEVHFVEYATSSEMVKLKKTV